MAIVDMKKITVIGMEADREQIIKRLMSLGTVQVVDVQERTDEEQLRLLEYRSLEGENLQQLEAGLSRTSWAIKYLSAYDRTKKPLFSQKRPLDAASYHEVLDRRKELQDVIDRISECDSGLASLRANENALENLNASLQPWAALDIPLNFAGIQSTSVITGTIPSSSGMGQLEEELARAVPESSLETVNTDGDQAYVVLLAYRTLEEEALQVLRKYGFSPVSFKELDGTAADAIERNSRGITAIQEERDRLVKELEALVPVKRKLEVLHDHFQVMSDRAAVMQKLAGTGNVFLLEGWVPSYAAGQVEAAVGSRWDSFVSISEPAEDEHFPVLLKNNRFVQPFELITELYSLPSSRGIDPNLFMAPFYFVFFGLMVSDAGYGLAMMIATAFILRKYKPRGMANKLVRLLFFGSISTFVWGALFGGWFGNIISLVTNQRYSIPPIWFDPIDNPMKLLLWSFIFGGIHLFTGMGLQAYKLIREGKYLDALFDIGFWYLLLIGLVLLAPGGTAAVIGKYMAIAGAVLLVLTQGRNEKKIIKKITSGILSLYNVTGYLSDVLSYSRLLALGLATGVIANVVNTMGTLFGINPVSVIILAVVFIGGHAFNIVINALGAYVHSSRLQYVEFFGKFFEGGGKAFRPFGINTKFIEFKDEEAV